MRTLSLSFLSIAWGGSAIGGLVWLAWELHLVRGADCHRLNFYLLVAAAVMPSSVLALISLGFIRKRLAAWMLVPHLGLVCVWYVPIVMMVVAAQAGHHCENAYDRPLRFFRDSPRPSGYPQPAAPMELLEPGSVPEPLEPPPVDSPEWKRQNCDFITPYTRRPC